MSVLGFSSQYETFFFVRFTLQSTMMTMNHLELYICCCAVCVFYMNRRALSFRFDTCMCYFVMFNIRKITGLGSG